MSFSFEACQGLATVELTSLDTFATATQDKKYLEALLSEWKYSAEPGAEGLLDYQLYTAMFIYNHAGWVITDDTRPIIDTLLQIIADRNLVGKNSAEYLISHILKGVFENKDQESWHEKRYQSFIASTAATVEKLWQQKIISTPQTRQWMFFQYWMQMERQYGRKISLSQSQTCFPEAWPICIEGTENSTAHLLPPISSWFGKNQTPLVASAAPENASEETLETENQNESPISDRSSLLQSMADAQSSQQEVPSKSKSPSVETKKASQSVRVTRQKLRVEKDNGSETSKRGRLTKPALRASRRRKRTPREEVKRESVPLPIITEWDGPGSSFDSPFVVPPSP